MKKIFTTIIAVIATIGAQAQIDPNITTEYFFDRDPGFGKGKIAGVSSNGTQKFKADLSNLKQGFHTLNVRGKNVFGWSQTQTFQFVLFEKTSEIIGTEYYFNEDPGHGKGKFTAIAPNDSSVNIKQSATKLDIDVSGINPGYHILNVRALNGDKTWSDPITTPFIYAQAPEIPKKAEYYIDRDPGEGNGSVIKTSNNNTIAFALETEKQKDGNHILFIRTQDEQGNWNMEESSPFQLKKINDNTKADWILPVYLTPNPAQYSFTIQFGKVIKDSVNVVVSSLSGKEMSNNNYMITNNEIKINTAPYTSGSYLVTITKDSMKASKRLIIKKVTE